MEAELQHVGALASQFQAIREIVDSEMALVEQAEHGVRWLIDLTPEAAAAAGPDSIGVAIARTIVSGDPICPPGRWMLWSLRGT